MESGRPSVGWDCSRRWTTVSTPSLASAPQLILGSWDPRTDEDKLRVYVRIVRLLLEDEDSVQAETYYNRAASLVHTTQDKELLLRYKLCQARIHDYSRRFLEAGLRYLDLSYVAEIDEEERKHML